MESRVYTLYFFVLPSSICLSINARARASGTWARTMFWTALRLRDAITIASVCFRIASQVSLHRMGVATDATTRYHVSRTKEGRKGLFRPLILEQPDLALKFWSQVLVAASFWVCVLASIARWWLMRQTRNKSWLCQLLCVVIAVFLFWYLMGKYSQARTQTLRQSCTAKHK